MPLETPWTLTYWHGSDWQVPLVVAEDIATAGTFFGVHNAVPRLSAIVPGTYNLFRRGTRPVWEDAVHAGGGKWTRSFSVMPPAATAAAVWKEAEAAWLHMQLWALGENGGDKVVGVSAAVRRAGVRLSIWVTAASVIPPSPAPEEAYVKEACLREGRRGSGGGDGLHHFLIYASHEGSIQRGRAYEGGPPSLLLH